MAVRGTATPQLRLASILARAKVPTLSVGLLVSDIRTWPSWVVRSICGEICRTRPTRSGALSRLIRTVAPGLSFRRWTLGTSASSSISLLTEIRNIGPACGEAGAPAAVLTSVTRPAAGARSDVGPGRPAGAPRRRRRLRRLCQPRQFLIFGDGVAFADQQVGDPRSLLIDADLRFTARHDEAGDPDHVGEAGIARFGHDHQRLARRFLFFRVGAVLEPVIADAEHSKESHSKRRFEIFGEVHRRINPDCKSKEAGGIRWCI